MALRVTGYLGLDGSALFGTLGRAENAVNRFGRSAANALGSRMAALFSVGAMGVAARKTTEYAGRMVDLASRTGVAVETLQRFDKALLQNGSNLETMVNFWERLNVARSKALSNPAGPEAAAFGKFGITGADLATSSAEQLTRKIAVAFQGSGNIAQLTADLQELGGMKGVGQLVASFKEGLDKMSEDTKVMTTEQALILDEIDDKLAGLWNSLAVYLAPALVEAIDGVRNLTFALRLMVEYTAGVMYELSASAKDFGKGLLSGGFAPLEAVKAFAPAIARAHERNTTAIQEMLAEEVEQRLREEEALAAKAAQLRNPIAQRYTAESAQADQKAARAANRQQGGDALLAVGNFLGASQGTLAGISSRILDQNRIQTMHLAQISARLQRMSGFGLEFP